MTFTEAQKNEIAKFQILDDLDVASLWREGEAWKRPDDERSRQAADALSYLRLHIFLNVPTFDDRLTLMAQFIGDPPDGEPLFTDQLDQVGFDDRPTEDLDELFSHLVDQAVLAHTDEAS